jgi:hypothetical protein
MKNFFKQNTVLIAITMITVIGLTFAACGKGKDSGSKGTGKGGTFMLTGIPSEYNGKYAMLSAPMLTLGAAKGVIGVQTFNEKEGMKLAPISKGSVSIPLWQNFLNAENLSRYSGNDKTIIVVLIYDSETTNGNELGSVAFLSVSFKNGSATAAWKDGTFTKK